MSIRRLLMAAMSAALLAIPGRADIEPLSLFQKIARAPLIARVRALSDSTRRPPMEVLEVLKGEFGAPRLVVVPHFEDKYKPTPWLNREVFREGEESILFLQPYVDDFGRAGEPGTFSLLNADQGKLPIPAEGSEALIGALRRILEIQSIGEYDDQILALRDTLRAGNPFLVEAGLDQCARFHLATADDLQALLDLLEGPRPDFRAGALVLLEQIVGDSLVRDPTSTFPKSLFDRIAAAARLDEEDSVRARAVGTLAAFGNEAALLVIESIGAKDDSQEVRYRAQVAAYRLKRAQP